MYSDWGRDSAGLNEDGRWRKKHRWRLFPEGGVERRGPRAAERRRRNWITARAELGADVT